MESVGEFFRHVRETKGLTIDEVASKTRIRADFLKALEEGNFAKLPDQVFAKGFVRTYARSLGLDEDDAMQRFNQSAGAFYDKQEERERLRHKQAEDERRRRSNRKVMVLAVGVALLVLVLVLTREQSGLVSRQAPEPPPLSLSAPPPLPPVEPLAPEPAYTGQPEEAPVVAAPPTVEPAPISEPSVSTDTAVAALPPAMAAQEESTSLPLSLSDDLLGGTALESPLVLDLEALELTWVVVQIDGGSPHEALLRPGERVTWRGLEQFTLTLGNAGGVRVELNGEPRGPFGPSGSVARDIVLRSGGAG